MAREARTVAQIDANRLDRDIFHLAARIDQLCEIVSRGKSKMDPALIAAAKSVDAARAAVRKHMHPDDQIKTLGAA